MRELQRVVKHAHRLRFHESRRVAGDLGRLALLGPRFVKSLVLIPTVPEGTHGVDIEWILALARNSGLLLRLRDVRFRKRLLTVFFEALAKPLVLRLRIELEERYRGCARLGVWYVLVLERSAHHIRFLKGCRKDLSAPHPFEGAFAVRFGLIVHTSCARLLSHDRRRLQPIGEDDVRVHGAHVQVIDHGLLRTRWVVAKSLELLSNGGAHSAVIGDLFAPQAFEQNLVLKRFIQSVKQALQGVCFKFELDRNVIPVDSSLQALDMAAHVRLTFE